MPIAYFYQKLFSRIILFAKQESSSFTIFWIILSYTKYIQYPLYIMAIRQFHFKLYNICHLDCLACILMSLARQRVLITNYCWGNPDLFNHYYCYRTSKVHTVFSILGTIIWRRTTAEDIEGTSRFRSKKTFRFFHVSI